MNYNTILLDIHAGIAHLTLNRPEAHNAVNLDLARDLADAALRCQNDSAVRAVILSGEGRAFCVGGDLKDFAARGEQIPVYLEEVTANLHLAVSRLARMSPPVIAAVQGTAAGAGMSLACAADLVVAGESTRFTMAYTRIGLSPDGSATYFLPRLVGLKRALDLVLTNRVLSASEAEDWGIVSRVVPDADILAAADDLTRELSDGPTSALGMSKRLLQRGWTETLETQMALETRGIAEMARGDDAREGISAFLDKRAPNFQRG